MVNITKLNEDIKLFPKVSPITDDMHLEREGVNRLIMLDRYAYKDTEKKTLDYGDLVVLTVNPDPKFPARGVGYVEAISEDGLRATVQLEEAYAAQAGVDRMEVPISAIDKPLELFYEQIAERVARGLAEVEPDKEATQKAEDQFYDVIASEDFVPAGRVLYGAGAGTDVTFFNCLSGDTVVQTENGSEQIKDLRGNVKVLSMDGKVREAHFKSYGKQELYEVMLENGEAIKATAGHEWYYPGSNGLKKTNTLNLEGKRIPIVKKRKKLDDEDLIEGIRHGIVYGDGTTQHGEANVKLFGNKVELVRFFKGFNVAPHYNGDYVGIYGLDEMLKLCLPSATASDSYWHGFIQGLIATDGYVDNRGSFGFHSKNEHDLRHIVDNLYRTNFSYHSLKMAREINPFNGEKSPCYKVQLTKQSGNPIDFIRSAHRTNFENSGESKRTATVKVVSVKPLGYSEEVYCCEEPETNSFVIGTGYLTSNCFVMPFPKDSREGIGEHRNEVMEIMSRGGGKLISC